ncbi:MAG TPA: site-specific integrase, partial [Dehalococcoidia bacterium]|nr:site-specific integrase [Dehalococcoidia bacterium]
MLERFTARETQSWRVPKDERFTVERIAGARGLKGYLKTFLLTCKVNELSPDTIDDYNYKIGVFISYCISLGVDDPTQVTPDDIRQFILHLQERNNSSASVYGYYKCVKRFFNWLVEEDILSSSPMARIRPPKVPSNIIVPFRPEHIETLLQTCDQSSKFLALRNRAIILTFL